MKKLIIISVLAIACMASCKPKNETPIPIQFNNIDSIAFSSYKNSGDTISTYTNNKNGTFTISFVGFHKKTVLSGKSITINIKSEQGTIKYNNQTVNSKTLTDIPLTFDYYPMDQSTKGIQQVIISTTSTNIIFTDTISFYIKTYQPIPFTVNYNGKYFPNQNTTSNVLFDFSVKNGLLNNTTYRYKTSQLISKSGNYGGTTLLFNNNNGIYLNTFYSFESNTVQNLKIELSNNLIGTYYLPIEIWDSYNTVRKDTITYIVK